MEETYGRLLCNRRMMTIMMMMIKFSLLYHLSFLVDVFINGFWTKCIKNIEPKNKLKLVKNTKIKKTMVFLHPKLVVSEVRSTRPRFWHSNICGATSHVYWGFETINFKLNRQFFLVS